MRACSMASGAVFFIPDEIARKDCTKAAPKNEARTKRPPSFGKRKPLTGLQKNNKTEADIRSAA